MDPPDRVARGVLANPGEPRRILRQAGPRPILAAPCVTPMEGRGRDGPRPDEEPIDARPLRADVELASHPLEGGERPGVAEDLPAAAADHERPLPHDHARAGLVV